MFKEEIVRVLGEIGDPMATGTLIELLHDEDRMVRYYSARALHKMEGRDVVQSLCGLLNDPDEWIVINVLEILSNLNDPEAIPALVGQFEVARDSRLKAIIISSLSTFAEGKLLGTFEKGLDSFDPRIQANSVEAISKLKIPALEMKRKLKRFFGHPNNRVRGNLCIALAQADPQAVMEELETMRESSDASTRRSAAYVLAKVPLEGRERFIYQLLEDDNFGVRKMALKAAMELEKSLGVKAILPHLNDENQWVRKQAVECANLIEDFPSLNIMEMLEKEESPAVVESLLKFVVNREMVAAISIIFERIRREPEEELPWLISSLGHLGAVELLGKVKRFLGPVRADVFSQYYQALLLNGDLEVFTEISQMLKEKKRKPDLLAWTRIAGDIGDFAKRTENYSKTLKNVLIPEIQKDMEGIAVFDAPKTVVPDEDEIEKAVALHDNKDYVRAREIFRSAIEANGNDKRIAFYLASCMYNLGDSKNAVIALEKVCSQNPDYFDAGLLLGQIYFRKKSWSKLIECYERISSMIDDSDKRNSIRVYGALGLAYFHQQKYDLAISALARGLKANPRDLSSSYHLALCYYAKNENEKARKILENLRKTLPSDSKILKNVIQLLQRI
jgi:HEAT repeat protein/thioredoxin-like negative regulator of GroEL